MRTWLYRSDHPAGRIFDTEDAIAQALHDGWVDDPARVHDENPEDGNPDDGIDVEIEDVLTMTVPEVTEYINDQDDPAMTRAILEHENTRDPTPRGGVLNAIDKRLGELETGE